MPGHRPAWWESRSFVAVAWWPVSLLFRCAVALRRALFGASILQSCSVPVPVIVVGNLAVGGSGKTPVVLWLVEKLRQRGFRPGVVSRGYGGSARNAQLVVESDDAAVVGDEPLFLAIRSGAPVAIGRDRVAACRCLLAAHPDVNVIVSDDGLQHYRMQRAAEILVIDEALLGNRWLLPAGPLREPLRRASQVTLVIAHGALGPSVQRRLAAVPVFQMRLEADDFYRASDSRQRRSAQSLQPLRAKAIAGIGRPQRFFETLRHLGLQLQREVAFPDHHPFAPGDLELDGADILLMTEKDAIKCASFAPRETWVLPVNARIDDAALALIVERVHGPKAT